MEREILFRGKRIDNGEWVEGMYLYIKGHTYPSIFDMEGFSHIIITKTLGQFTGVLDKNDKKIFEGDIVKYENKIYEIKYLEKYARFAPSNESTVFMVCAFNHLEVVGNIYDNPELLKDDDILSEKLK